jgi:hypothetical protein
MWGMFAVAVMGLLFNMITLEKFVLFGILFIATLLEEQYYLITEEVLKHGRKL